MTVPPARHEKGAPAGVGGQFRETAKGEPQATLSADKSSRFRPGQRVLFHDGNDGSPAPGVIVEVQPADPERTPAGGEFIVLLDQQLGGSTSVTARWEELAAEEASALVPADTSARSAARTRIAAIREELATLAQADPEGVSALMRTAAAAARDSVKPQLHLGTPTEAGSPRPLIDPFTGEETDLVAEEYSSRDTRSSEINSDKNAVIFAYGTSDGDFDTIAYRSTSSGRYVDLPDGWEEDYR